MNDEILDQVRDVAAGLFDMPKARVTPELTPGMVEAWDSVQQLNLMLELEQTFGVRLDPEDTEEMQSIGQIVNLIERKRRG